MDAADILVEEHRIIEQVIAAMDKQAMRLQGGVPVRAGFFLDTADFIRNYADSYHNRQEEELLFPAMGDAGLSNQTGPIAILLAEHAQARMYARAMERAARKINGDPSAAREDVFLNVQGYSVLLRQHIRRENDFFYPLAGRLIPPDQQKKLNAEFNRFDHAEFGPVLREKYRALVVAIEKEASG
jgi:hemerythrin-like domain-containing protein